MKDLLCVLEDPLTGNIIYQNVRYVKKYKNRDDVFKELSPDLQKIVGYPFNPLNFSSRRELIDFLARDRLDIGSEHENQSINFMAEGDSSIVSNLPGYVPEDIASGPHQLPRQSISTQSSAILEDDCIASEISSPTRMFQTPLVDEFFPEESETDDKQEEIQAPLAPESVPTNDDVTQTNTNPSGSPGVPPNPWRRITRAAAKLRKK